MKANPTTEAVPDTLHIEILEDVPFNRVVAYVVEFPQVRTYTRALAWFGLCTDSKELCRRLMLHWCKYWRRTHQGSPIPKDIKWFLKRPAAISKSTTGASPITSTATDTIHYGVV